MANSDAAARDRHAAQATAEANRQAAEKQAAITAAREQEDAGGDTPAPNAPRQAASNQDLQGTAALIAQTLLAERQMRVMVPPPTVGLDESPVPGGIGIMADGRITNAYGVELKDDVPAHVMADAKAMKMQARRVPIGGMKETDSTEETPLQVGN
jgi:hypothetical protein